MKVFGHIYLVTNLKNGRNYVGQTIQKNPYKRIDQHFQNKQQGVHLLGRAIKKYGKRNFSVKLLISCFDRESLDYFEVRFIKEFVCLAPNGYNIAGGGTFGSNKVTPQMRKKISKRFKEYYKTHKHPALGRKISLKTKRLMSRLRKGFTSPARIAACKKSSEQLMKKIRATNIKTGQSQIFKSVAETVKQLNVSHSCVSRVCRGDQNRSQHKGYTFSFVNDKTAKPQKLIDKTYQGINKQKKYSKKYVVMVSKNNKRVYLGSFKDKESALKAKILFLNEPEEYKYFIKQLIDQKKVLLWKKRRPELKDI